jgi:hypothetical protein
MIRFVYELQNIGKGAITVLDETNLLLLYTSDFPPYPLQGLQDVITFNAFIGNGGIAFLENGYFSIDTGNIAWSSGSFLVGALTTPTINSVFAHVGFNSSTQKTLLKFYSNKTIFEDEVSNKGIQYGGDYELNFTSRSLITKQYADTINLQKEKTTSFTLNITDNCYTIFINNGATPITITIPSGLPNNFCVGFIQEGTGDVTFVGSGTTVTNPIGLKSKGQGYQTFLEKKLATETYYLLGNTKA